MVENGKCLDQEIVNISTILIEEMVENSKILEQYFVGIFRMDLNDGMVEKS